MRTETQGLGTLREDQNPMCNSFYAAALPLTSPQQDNLPQQYLSLLVYLNLSSYIILFVCKSVEPTKGVYLESYK